MSRYEEFIERSLRKGGNREELEAQAIVKIIKAYYDEVEQDEQQKVSEAGDEIPVEN